MANKTRKILLLPGDGIGPEVVAEARRILEWMNKTKSLDFVLSQELIGGASIDANKVPITDEVFYKSLESDAVILGACGGPKWDNLEFSKKPERALLKLRKELKLFANLRPAICFKQLVDSSTLKPEIVSGLDIMIVRELTGGIYFGEPRGIEPMENNQRTGVNTHTYTTSEIHRIARVAFDLAKKRRNKVTSCEKSNVMEAGVLWREEVQIIKDKEFKKDQEASEVKQEEVFTEKVGPTMTISEIDLLRQQLHGCLNLNVGVANLKEIKPVIYIEVNPDRTVKSSKVVNKEKLNDPSFRTAAEAAMRAVNNPDCSPLLLPADKYEQWKEINFTFDFILSRHIWLNKGGKMNVMMIHKVVITLSTAMAPAYKTPFS